MKRSRFTEQQIAFALKQQESGSYAIDETILARLAPYRTSHINRFSDYLLDAAKRSSAN